jgi:hypothetical protein
MKKIISCRRALVFVYAAMGLVLLPQGQAADSFEWNASKRRISAEVNAWPLPRLLEKISNATGWEIYVEPGTTFTASAKFQNLPLGEALHSLLGGLNFALVPQTNAAARLYVFQTTMQAATQMVAGEAKLRKSADPAEPIPNQLVVTVKPGTDIEALARQFGAKVVGRVPGLNTYLLEFPDATATQTARPLLSANGAVAAVDSNFLAARPTPPQPLLASSSPFANMRAKASSAGTPTVGLIDTWVDAKGGGDLAGFLQPAISVAGPAAGADGTPSHGTSMAWTIVQAAGGDVRILPVDVYGRNETTTTFAVADGIYRAVNAGANPINLSLTSAGDSAFLRQVIQQAHSQGVVFYAAAGNEPVVAPMYPAAYPEVVSVTAGSQAGNLASFANRSSTVDVVGPGSSMVSYDGQSWMVTGTSTSAAWVSGKAAGVAAGRPGVTAAEVQAAVVKGLPKPALAP